jgi:hypothetical protein
MDYSTATTCKEYATMQGANYDEQTNQIMYGQPLQMRALGVNDGTCKNLINPLLQTDNYKSGLGTAGGGCDAVRGWVRGQTMEPFDGKPYNYWYEVIVTVIIILALLHVCGK